MENIKIDGDALENGWKLYTTGPINKNSLPRENIEDLLTYELATVDEDEIVTLTEVGIEYFKQVEAEEKENRRIIEESEKAEETQDDDIDVESGMSDTLEVAQESFNRYRKSFWVSVEAAKIDANNVAMEGISEILKNSLPGIINGFNGFLNAIKPSAKLLSFSFKRPTLVERVEKVAYVNLAQLPIPVPQGLMVPYLDYISILETAVERAEKVDGLINAFTTTVAQLITNPDLQKDTRSHTSFYRDLQNSRDTTYATIGACFSNNYKAKQPYGTMIRRNAEWNDIINRSNDLIDRMNKIDRKGLINKSKQLGSMLKKVKESSKYGGFDSASPETIKLLADGSYQMASELEYYAVIYYRVQALTATIDQCGEFIIKATKP